MINLKHEAMQRIASRTLDERRADDLNAELEWARANNRPDVERSAWSRVFDTKSEGA